MIIANTGLWLMPNLSTQFWVSQNLVRNPFATSEADYLYSSYLMPALFWLFGGRSLMLYIAFAFCLSLAFIGGFSVWFVCHHGQKTAIDEFKLFTVLTFPIFFIPIYGIGMDAMTLLLILAILVYWSSRWRFIPAVLLGIQHFEQGLLSFLVLAFSIVLSFISPAERKNKIDLPPLAIVIVSIIFGKAFLKIWFWLCNLKIRSERVTYLQDTWQNLLENWLQYWPLIAWSLFGVGWLIVLTKSRVFWPLLTVAILMILLTMTVFDQTRVSAIVMFPSLFYWLLRDKAFWKALNLKLSIAVLVLYLIVPPVFVLGRPYSSLWQYDRQMIQQIIENGGRIDGFDSGLPFK